LVVRERRFRARLLSAPGARSHLVTGHASPLCGFPKLDCRRTVRSVRAFDHAERHRKGGAKSTVLCPRRSCTQIVGIQPA
jgi:hypothetical protein